MTLARAPLAVAKGAAAPEAWLRDVLDALGHRMVILDSDGRIGLANAAWRAAYGSFAAEVGVVRGRGHRDVLRADPWLTDDDATRLHHDVQRVLGGEAPEACCDYGYARGGEPTRWFSMEARALPKGGHGVIVSHFEATVYRRAEARLRAAVKSRANDGHPATLGLA